MSIQRQYTVLIVLVAAAFGAGRYSVQVKESETVKNDEVVKRNNDVKTIKKEVIVKEPNGKETKTIVTETEDKTTTTKEKEISKAVVSGPIEVDKYQVNVMIGVNRDNFMVPIYGVSASKKFIGPIAIGAWGLTNGTGGLSVGMSF